MRWLKEEGCLWWHHHQRHNTNYIPQWQHRRTNLKCTWVVILTELNSCWCLITLSVIILAGQSYAIDATLLHWSFSNTFLGIQYTLMYCHKTNQHFFLYICLNIGLQVFICVNSVSKMKRKNSAKEPLTNNKHLRHCPCLILFMPQTHPWATA